MSAQGFVGRDINSFCASIRFVCKRLFCLVRLCELSGVVCRFDFTHSKRDYAGALKSPVAAPIDCKMNIRGFRFEN